MARPGFADRNKLRDWADARQSQSEFPRLIRRLILETTPGVVELGMPAGEGVAAGRWDGTLRATGASAWVPEGLSVWELSVDDHPGTKAEDDYTKRASTRDATPTSDCTYVEAILRPWTKRNEWSTRKKSEKKWRDVRAYGLDDVETWLETAPITWAWFSEELGLNPYGMQTAETRWKAWSTKTSPVFTPEVVLAGREAAVTAVLERVMAAGVTTLEGASLDESCAFLAAIAVQQDLLGDGALLARLAFVDDLSTWRLLLESPAPLALVPMNAEFAHEVPADTHHTVLVPLTEVRIADVELPPLDAARVSAALLAAGMEDERKADEAGRLARRSLTALRRHLAQNMALHRPTWAVPPISRHIRAGLLAGSWKDEREGDRDILSRLAGEGYDGFREAASGLAVEADPFITRVGGSWHLVSAVDAWLLLVDRLTGDDLKRFESVLLTVLGEEDPALDVPEKERWWKASFEGKVRTFSADLRRGLARSLALLGVHGDAIPLPGGSSGSTRASYLVRSLLKDANGDTSGRKWASLSELLPLLAEAAPDEFLDAVAAGAKGADPVLAKMFTDQENTGLFSSNSPHSHLLWALEGLAWSPDHLGGTIDLLARLSEVDPGGRLTNRPFRSLAEIFCPWHPENAATPERRLKVIDSVRRRHRDIAWKLLLSMLPEFHGTHFPTHAPEYRDWKPSQSVVTRREYLEFISAVVARCVEDVGNDGQRWKALLADYSNLPPDDRETVRTALTVLVDSGRLPAEDACTVWTALRELVDQHREFADADWALAEDALGPLDALVHRLRPSGARTGHEWLFQDYMPRLGDQTRRDGREAYEALLAARRAEAVRDIEAEGGMDAVRDLVANVQVQWSVGLALATACPTYDDVVLHLLSATNAPDLQLAGQYFVQRFRDEGWPWLTDLIGRSPEISPLQRARLLLAARDLPRAWEVAGEQGPEVAENYWKLFVPYGLGGDFTEVELVAEKLMSVGRNAMAVDFLHMYMSRPGSDEEPLAHLIAHGLEGLLRSADDPELGALSSYDFKISLELLERHRESVGVDRLARLEWGLLPALGHDPDAPSLHQGMAEDPESFVEVVCAVYRPRTDDSEPDEGADLSNEQREVRAHNGYRLLSSWNHVPGLAEGSIDSERLHAWLEEARRLLEQRGRLEVGLVHFGHVLAAAPPDPDGSWPPQVVRDLIQELESEEVESGLSTEIFNRRGITSRGPEEGGAQEDALAGKYRADADAFADEWPRIAGILRRIANSYDADARRNEDSAERFRRGLA